MESRIIGIDVGVTSAHIAWVVDGGRGVICKRQTRPILESLSALEYAPVVGAGFGRIVGWIVGKYLAGRGF